MHHAVPGGEGGGGEAGAAMELWLAFGWNGLFAVRVGVALALGLRLALGMGFRFGLRLGVELASECLLFLSTLCCCDPFLQFGISGKLD